MAPQARRIHARSGEIWSIAEEVPVEIGFNGKAWSVMLATPSELEDLAIGLALTEGVIASGTEIEAVEIKAYPEGISADIRVAADAIIEARRGRRTLSGRTGCGLCGIESLAALHTPKHRRTATGTPPDKAVKHAFSTLAAHQPLNRQTHSVHAAAWCTMEGDILSVREDVGRHNALDKLAGHLLRGGEIAEPGFVLMSSRCSFELIFKAARIGASAIACLSAPTGRAIDLAEALDLAILARGPGGSVIRFEAEANS
ncbi:formate dehydrogenase accessory sulfurtransferase FdhD [Maricaulis sp.]|uniref:formate dehydrogenase accessory sulfurtransferase FdhD n=1 Tax=Maricaulis sp. TaxID=1486257 RepID=UPI00260B02DF|nr:formate dehydrogenase accessory sulfurtransferase FdhD [Maricaulis sp.]